MTPELIIPSMTIPSTSLLIPMDHLVTIVIITNLLPHLGIDLNVIIVVHIPNKLDVDENRVLVHAHHLLVLVRPLPPPLLPQHPTQVQHPDLILVPLHHLLDQAIHQPVVLIESQRGLPKNKMMMRTNVQV